MPKGPLWGPQYMPKGLKAKGQYMPEGAPKGQRNTFQGAPLGQTRPKGERSELSDKKVVALWASEARESLPQRGPLAYIAGPEGAT